jgi:hypothetical protein
VIAEELQLGPEGFLNGPLDDGLADLDGEGLDGIEVAIEPGPVDPVGAAGDDFPPPEGQVAEIGPILGLSLGERHGESILELGDREKMEKPP